MDPEAPAVVAAPAAAGAGAAAAINAARRPAGLGCEPVLSWGAVNQAQIVMAAAAAAFAVFASTLQPTPNLPAQCLTTAAETMMLRYKAGLLLRCAIAQAGAAAAALVITPPSKLKRSLTAFVNLLALPTLAHLIGVVSRVLSATGGSCFTGHFRTAEFIFHNIIADIFLYAVPLIWIFGQWEGFE